jgi:hypothetical protein
MTYGYRYDYGVTAMHGESTTGDGLIGEPVLRQDEKNRRKRNDTRPIVSALLEDYKLKVQYATDVLNRYQTQSQILLSLQVAAATAMVLSSTGELSRAARWIVLVEVGLSVVWISVGWQGRARVRNARTDSDLAGLAWAEAADLPTPYTPVGDRRPIVRIGFLAPVGLLFIWLTIASILWL